MTFNHFLFALPLTSLILWVGLGTYILAMASHLFPLLFLSSSFSHSHLSCFLSFSSLYLPSFPIQVISSSHVISDEGLKLQARNSLLPVESSATEDEEMEFPDVRKCHRHCRQHNSAIVFSRTSPLAPLSTVRAASGTGVSRSPLCLSVCKRARVTDNITILMLLCVFIVMTFYLSLWFLSELLSPIFPLYLYLDSILTSLSLCHSLSLLLLIFLSSLFSPYHFSFTCLLHLSFSPLLVLSPSLFSYPILSPLY